MAATTKQSAPAKQVVIDVLRKAGEPLHAKEIAKRVLATGRCAGLKGKTPEATITAMLAVGSKPSGPFTRVDKGTYTLASTPSEPNKQQKRTTTAKRPAARKQATARKKTAATKSPTKRTR